MIRAAPAESADAMDTGSDTSVLFVVYRTERLDLRWIPPDAQVIVVHNDDHLDGRACPDRAVVNVRLPENVGFGAGVNAGLPHVDRSRLIICNPDTTLQGCHWTALTSVGPEELVTVPQVDGAGRPGSVFNRYPTAFAFVLTVGRVGRFAPRGSRRRAGLAKLIGRWGRAHVAHMSSGGYQAPLSTHWLSGAVLSVDVQHLRGVGGFDPSFFLYFEDVDLCARLAASYPGMTARVAAVRPALHRVGESGLREADRTVLHHRLTSAVTYAQRQSRWRWRAVEGLLAACSRPRRSSAGATKTP